MAVFQDKVRALYNDQGYTSHLGTLVLGLVEEVGEVCAALNDVSPYYKPKAGRIPSDLAHELNDCLIYLCAIANSANIDLGI